LNQDVGYELLRVIVDLGLSSPQIGGSLFAKKLSQYWRCIGVDALKSQDLAKGRLRNAQNFFSWRAKDTALGYIFRLNFTDDVARFTGWCS
jgi:hypothetical protein